MSKPEANKPKFEHTELGNAMRLIHITEGQYIWTPDNQRWNHYNGNRWQVDNFDSIYNAIHDVLRDIEKEKLPILEEMKKLKDNPNVLAQVARSAEYQEYKKGQKEISFITKWCKTSQSQRAMQAMISLAKVQPGVSKDVTEFDKKGHYLGTESGSVDLRDGTLHSDDPSYLVSMASPLKYNPNSTCQQFKKFLYQIMEGKQDLVDFLQVLMGSAAVGRKSSKFFIFYGERGGNGKSTLVDLIIHVLGEYASVGNPNILTGTFSSSDYHLAQAKGKRLLVFNETSKDDVQLAEPLIKSSTDSGMITARHPACRPFQFQPVFTPIFCVNHLPNTSMDPALWRRLVIVPFNYQIPPDERDPEFVPKLIRDEGEGILNWVIEGAKLFINNGLTVPASILQSTNQSKQSLDVIGQFIEETCVVNPDEKVKLKDLNHSFTKWAEENQFKKRYTTPNFARELRDREYEVRKSTGGINWVFGLTSDSNRVNFVRANAKNADEAIKAIEN